jgi:hypothetical protein
MRQTFVLTPATKVATDRSVLQLTTNYTNVMKSTNAHVKDMLRNVIKYHYINYHYINYHYISIALAIIIGVAL